MSEIVGLPRVELAMDGVLWAAADTVALATVRVQQRLSQPSLCELTFRDPPGPLAAASRVPIGALLRVTVRAQTEPLFNGQVTAIEHVYEPSRGRAVRVRAYDRLHQLRKQQSVRAHIQVTLRELAQELSGAAGLDLALTPSGLTWPHLIQYRQSNLELLAHAAEVNGLYLTVRDNTLHLVTLEGDGEPFPLTLGRNLLEAVIEQNADLAAQSVRTSGWNALRAEAHTGVAKASRTGRNIAAQVAPDQVGGSSERLLVGESNSDDDHAASLAQAELDARTACAVTFWGMADGDPRLMPGVPVDVDGVDASVAGRYVLTSVTHTIDVERGFVSELSTAAAMLRPRESSAAMALGIVTSVDDPENKARIKVSLPAYQDVETDWMGVVSVGAGEGKGLIALPDVGDRVLVLLAFDDPGQGIVLGGLFGMDGAADSGIEAGRVKRFTLQTPGGQRIQLDDVKNLIRLEDHSGSFVELSPSNVTLHAAVDLNIEAPGKHIVIRGNLIDFEQG